MDNHSTAQAIKPRASQPHMWHRNERTNLDLFILMFIPVRLDFFLRTDSLDMRRARHRMVDLGFTSASANVLMFATILVWRLIFGRCYVERTKESYSFQCSRQHLSQIFLTDVGFKLVG